MIVLEIAFNAHDKGISGKFQTDFCEPILDSAETEIVLKFAKLAKSGFL